MTTDKSPVLGLTLATLVVFAVFGINRYLVSHSASSPDSVASTVNELPPAAAGIKSRLDGTKAVGQVSGVYVELGTNLYVSIERAPASLRKTANRFVNVEFPESLVKDFDSDSAIVKALDPAVEVGDVVEVKFIENGYAVGFNNVTRVTQIVATRGTEMAKSFELKIAARKVALKQIALRDK